MRFDYLTSDSEKSMSPFFSPMMASITFNCIWIIGVLLVALWPQKDLFNYLHWHKIPLTFLGTFVGTLLINSYVNLRCGRGEIFPKNIFSKMVREGVITLEEEHEFLSYGFIQSMLHVAFFILLVFPLLIFSAGISGISLTVFSKALSILFTAPLLCRLFSFLVYLLFGRWSLTGYLASRMFYIFFFFATGAFAAFVNPILLIYALHRGEDILTGLSMNAYLSYVLIVTAAILIVTLINHTIIKRNLSKERST